MFTSEEVIEIYRQKTCRDLAVKLGENMMQLAISNHQVEVEAIDIIEQVDMFIAQLAYRVAEKIPDDVVTELECDCFKLKINTCVLPKQGVSLLLICNIKSGQFGFNFDGEHFYFKFGPNIENYPKLKAFLKEKEEFTGWIYK